MAPEAIGRCGCVITKTCGFSGASKSFGVECSAVVFQVVLVCVGKKKVDVGGTCLCGAVSGTLSLWCCEWKPGLGEVKFSVASTLSML